MGIRALVAAAAVAVGVGSAADAAVYDYFLRYDRTVFKEVGTVEGYFDEVDAKDNIWGFPMYEPGFEAGQTYRLHIVTSEWNVVSCRLGEYDCGETVGSEFKSFSIDPFYFDNGNRNLFTTDNFNVGSLVTISDNGPREEGYWVANPDIDLFAYASFRESYFEVVNIAPVPLPATAALLPLGIGALAFLRKRRRAV